MRSKLGPGDVRIAYCGPIAQPSQPARGGYESANRRLLDDLRLRRVDVIEFAYPVALDHLQRVAHRTASDTIQVTQLRL